MCCMWYVCYFGIKISIHYHILCSFSRTKSISNGILNVHNIIRSEDGFVEFQPRTVANPALETLGAQPVLFKPDETK